MLGKRLVDYSDDEDGEGQAQLEVQKAAKPTKHISYSKVSSGSALKNILSATDSVATQKEITRELTQGKDDSRKIEFDTVSGKRTFELERPREKVWKGKQEREPYYYTAMKEIYSKKLKGIGVQDENDLMPPEPQHTEIEMIDGKREVVTTVNQANLVQFDYGKYMEEKERKDLLLEDKIKYLKGTNMGTTANHSKIGTKAYELLEKEAAHQALGTEEEGGIKRNKKQYGF